MAKASDNWMGAPKIEDEIDLIKMPLNQVGCPKCGYVHDTANNKMRAKIGFGQLTCKRCRQVTKASSWLCTCEVEWHKCRLHVHKDILRGVNLRAENLKRGVGTKFSAKGTDEPLPKRVRTEWSEVAISVSNPQSLRISLDDGLCPKLAERFPHIAKGASALSVM